MNEPKRQDYDGWDKFDADEYVKRNYGQVLPEDKHIIEFVISSLKEMGIKENSLKRVADVGAGPNLYPALLLSPYMEENGTFELIDVAPNNLAYLKKIISNSNEGPNTIWKNFEECIKVAGLNASLEKALRLSVVESGSIYELPTRHYDAVLSFFVAESITDKVAEFELAIKTLLDSLKPGGLFLTAHIVGSLGYYAGENTHFPAVNLTVEQLESAYKKYAEYKCQLFTHENELAAREGYSGMAAFVGRKH